VARESFTTSFFLSVDELVRIERQKKKIQNASDWRTKEVSPETDLVSPSKAAVSAEIDVCSVKRALQKVNVGVQHKNIFGLKDKMKGQKEHIRFVLHIFE
jgi:hypothetical protein